MNKYLPLGLTYLEKSLLSSAKIALNYIENTESELGIKLKSGDMLRASILEAENCSFHCCKGLAPLEECACYKNTLS